MTKAVCWRCGDFKFGAFVPCSSCGGDPATEDDLLVSFSLTDHFLDEEQLLFYSKRIKSGSTLQLDDSTKDKLRPAVLVAARCSANSTNGIKQGYGSTPASSFQSNSLQIKPVTQSLIGRLVSYIVWLVVLLIGYQGLKLATSGSPVALLGVMGFYWMVNSVAVFFNTFVFNDYTVIEKRRQRLVGVVFIVMSGVVIVLARPSNAIAATSQLVSCWGFLIPLSILLGVLVAMTGGGRTRRADSRSR